MTDFMIRLLDPQNFDQANRMLMLAFGNPTNRLADLQLYHRLQPDGWFAAYDADRIVGTVGAVRYPTFAHVGFMAVHPDFQRQGLGRRLMEFILEDLQNHAVPMVTLDASKSGHPLYLKLGFTERGTVQTFEAPATSMLLKADAALSPITTNDLEDLAAVDRSAFGDDRRKVFEALLSLYPGRGFLTRNPAGQVTGYLFAVQNRIGPWVALEAGAAETLLAAALSLEYLARPSVVVPRECQAAADLLLKHGFTQLRSGWHMALEDRHPPMQRNLIFAQTSMGAG